MNCLLKMEKLDVEKSEETNTPINGNTKCNSKQQIVEKANEHPEWLPDGWNVDVRIRKSGANMGSVYKCYIDPLNGYKFYSKPEVLRYLETIKDNSCTSKKESECTNSHSPSNVVVEKSSVEDLPPGWIKEVKVRKSGNGAKKDPFYIDPVSGYVFRSKKDVLRYLESGDIHKCAFKPSRRQIQDEDKSAPSAVAKRQELKQSATKQLLFDGEEIFDKGGLKMPHTNSLRKGQDAKVPSGMMVAPIPTGEFVVKMHPLEDEPAKPPELKKTSDPDDVQEKEHLVNVMENANEKNHNNLSISKNKKFNVRHRFSPRLAGIEPVQLADKINEQTLQVPKRNLRKRRTTLDADLENKSSQHFNGVPEIEHVHKIYEVINTSHNLSEDQAVFKEQPRQLETDKEDNKSEIPTDSNKSSNKKEHHIPCRASKRLAGLEHELTNNSLSCDADPKNKSKMSKDEVNVELQQSEVGPAMMFGDHAPINGESANKRRKSHKIPPSIDNHPDKVEDEEMDDEKSEPQLSFAFHYSWSDPSLESAINTLTGVLPAKDSVDSGPAAVLETDIKKTPFDSFTEGSGDRNPSLNFATSSPMGRLPAEDSVDTGPTTVLRSEIQQTLLDDATGRSRDRKVQVHSNKSKNKSELRVPTRLSKRLAGHEPEVLPSERALEYVSRKSCKEEPIATATAILTNGASDCLDAGEETKLTLRASDSLKTEVLGESSNKSEKSYDAQTVPKEQLQKVEAENIGEERSEPQLPLLFGDPWSDPCLEFAFKTLTGALPVDAAADILPVMIPDVNDMPNKEMHKSVVMSVDTETHDSSNRSHNKKERNMVSQPSKQLPGQPELRTSSASCENASAFTTRESYTDEGNITRNMDGEPLHIKAGNVTQLGHHSRNMSTLIHEEPLKKNELVLECENVTTEQTPLETETINRDNPESEFCASFMNSWSDPCLEFAFKTLTGAMPVEENLAIQGCFQEPANCHDRRDGGSTLPHFGSSSFSQSDISFNYDIGVESGSVQEPSMSTSFLHLGKTNLQGCPGVDPQKQYSQGSKNFQR